MEDVDRIEIERRPGWGVVVTIRDSGHVGIVRLSGPGERVGLGRLHRLGGVLAGWSVDYMPGIGPESVAVIAAEIWQREAEEWGAGWLEG